MADTVIQPLPPCTRIVLRAAPEIAAALCAPLGLAVPPMLTASQSGERAALRLGPDEWLLLAEAGAALLPALAHPRAAAVDISHRQHAFRIAGPEAADLLNEACPLDLGPAFPPGACTRTVFGKAEIVLWRLASDTFHLEVARSYAPYVEQLLAEALSDLA